MDYLEQLQSIKIYTKNNANADFDYYKSNDGYGFAFKITYDQSNYQFIYTYIYSVSELEFLAGIIYRDLLRVHNLFYNYLEDNLYIVDEASRQKYLYDVYTVMYVHLFNASHLQKFQ